MSRSKTPYLITVVGETASGKSDIAMHLAQKFDGELICADSWTVRKHMDIGTAKPSANDQQTVKHHLLNVVEPDEDFSAAVFQKLANEAIIDICQRGKVPIIVGGTGLYVDGIIYDYNFLPPGAPGQRDELNSLSVEELLSRIDENGIELGDTDIRNKRRLIRLLETNGAEQVKSTVRPNTIEVGLTSDRQDLRVAIKQRVDTMFAAGLEAEVRQLSVRYGWDCEGMKGIGYREWREYFEGSQNLATTHERIVRATLGLAKRQRTWFMRSKSIQWFTIPVNYAHVDEFVTSKLNN